MLRIRFAFLFAASVALPAACGPAAIPPIGDAVQSCATEGERRCQGQKHQLCSGGIYRTTFECDLSEQCSTEQICVGINSCGSGADLIYAVDTAGRLLSFNPRHDLNSFYTIGQLSCPAGPSLASFGDGASVPYSMAVDRNARALVTYSSGEIFSVDTETARCQATTYRPQSSGFSLFGMGFVTDGSGQKNESLYLAGYTDPSHDSADLGQLHTENMQLADLGPLPTWPRHPELSGTGAGELFGYFPGNDTSQVAQIDPLTRAFKRTWSLPGLSGDVQGWAFAHWGGRFYIFVSTQEQGQAVNRVLRFDPTDGSWTVVIADSPYQIYGAGVSTCAPYVVG